MIEGVSDGYTLPIRIVGIGYRAYMENGKLGLKVGFCHPIILDVPKDIQVSIPVPQRILLSGNDLQVVTQFAANIRKWRKPEPYNQKGIFVGDETIKKKEGKKR
jgi:large subunit ribosomal protein L6